MDELVNKKIDLLERSKPFNTAIDFGGMWHVDGLYAIQCVKNFYCNKVLLIDLYESKIWQKEKTKYPQIEFMKGDFRDQYFMDNIKERYDLGMCFDILLHQPECFSALKLMLSKVRRTFCIAQPVIEEKYFRFKNTMIFLPGSEERFSLRPHWSSDVKIFDIDKVEPSYWIWAMTPTAIRNMCRSLGWHIEYEDLWTGWFSKLSKWKMYRAIFKRTFT